MKQVKQIPQSLLATIHEKTLAKIAVRDNYLYQVGMHVAKMRFEDGVCDTIIPPLNIYISRITEKGVVSSEIEYRISYDNGSFPFGHVYGGAGYLCLGDIPVPRFVSEYRLMEPLETLFLYNDRNTSHGGAELRFNLDATMEIKQWLESNGLGYIVLPEPEHNWVRRDTVWVIGRELLNHYSVDRAYEKADEIFKLIFRGII